jgi:alpha-L-arabinofuranosidase B-like protein
VVDLNIGDTVGLEVWGKAGVRVRHRNFLGRVDPISSASSALDRADATFRVRAGLGDDGCVSLESVNYPGSFLRHREFVIHLDRRDGSRLFDQDATFCPQPVRDGSAVTLEAVNFPGRAVTLHADATLHLDVGAGTAFVVREAL